MTSVPPAPANPEIKYTKLFINNEWVDAKDGSTFATINPATEEKIADIAEAKEADVDAAVAAAQAAFAHGSEWRRTDPSMRGILLNKFADLIERDLQYLAVLESLDNGRIYADTYLYDIPGSIKVLRYFAGFADKYHGKTIPFDGDYFCYTKHEPVGVCAAILPWNFPISLATWKMGPCLAMGNVLVLKPAEQSSLTALYLASLVKEAGFPPGVFNVVTGFGKTTGSALAHHMHVDKIAFTGSGATGRLIQKAAADSNLKRVSLELGGKSPAIVFADVDVDYAVETSHGAIFCHSGQVCNAGSRTYVHADIYDEFVQKSIERAKKLKIGSPLDYGTEHGPVVSKEQEERVLKFLNKGIQDGCKLECGGKKWDGSNGYFIEPTVLTNVKDDMQITQEEVFGPIQQIYKFKDVSEVIQRANNTKYGLAAAVITNDINKVMAITNQIKAGMIWVNCYDVGGPGAPFGGFKESGLGRDKGEETLHQYTEVKTVITKILPR
ncbi:aldehyde dehydrogenase X, mitochondrial-like isoform X1 [Styela clava]